VPEAFRARLFDRFAQADSTDTRQKGGTGLGLNIAKSIVERHAGRIGFENPEDGGAAFWFELPLRQDVIEAPGTLALLPGARTLVCTADRELADALAASFAEARIPVDVVPTPEEALDRLAKSDHGLLILDLRVDQGEALALVRRLRASLSAAIPIVAVSHQEATSDISDLRALGILDWLERPLDRDQLVRALQRAGVGSGRRVLHVDDDPDLRAVVQAVLTPLANVTSVATVEEARRHLEQPFDVVILDLDLPDGSGAELLPVVAGRAGGALPVVIFSGTETSPEVARQVHAALVKSTATLGRLVAAVKSLIAADDEHARTVTSR
jgi:DNA-binding response OmpR family regulator